MFLRWALISLMLLCLQGCDDLGHEHNGHAHLKVGTNQWPGYEPLHLAQHLGLHDSSQIKLIELTSATDVINAFELNQLDVAALTLDESLRVMERLPEVSIILVTDISNGADALIAQPDIQLIEQLKGKTIGVEESALGAFFLTQIVSNSALSRDDITVIPATVNSHFELMSQHKLDAVITFEPISSKLEEKGFLNLFDSQQIPGKIVDVLLAHNHVLDEFHHELKLMAESHWKALDFLNAHPQEAARLLAPRLHITPEQLEQAYQGLILPNHNENKTLLSTSLHTTIRELEQVMLNEGLLSNAVFKESMITDEVVN